MKDFPIDAVITWVDGADPAHKEKLRRYAPALSTHEDDVAGPTRFSSIGEIYWCVRSLRKFAPFIRRIFIVTDAQDPHIPEGDIPVEIVDHRTIFDGYGQYLPVFNSIAIETMTWRIPGLSEHYIELNDDFMLCAPVGREDFYTDEGLPVCYAKKYNIPFERLTRALKCRENGHRKVTFKGVMLNGAILAGARWTYYRMNHAPRPLLKSFFENFCKEHPEHMLRNISFRFRDAAQYSSEELLYTSLLRAGKAELRNYEGLLFYYEPKDKKGRLAKKFDRFDRGNYRFCCFNSLDKADAAEQEYVRGRIEGILA